ncbi:hypothetical protein LUZ62_083652 [Rhynchospora pubera]|uniref:ATPase AAA-type core domain-containing protein n=1 Tax=Rhynchospora pubera TaxID=906938 RepID=A0AAV8C3U3_9POAL|nr:hypothetical protein LUZ62_083652 [Rhynchospora pubera]
MEGTEPVRRILSVLDLLDGPYDSIHDFARLPTALRLRHCLQIYDTVTATAGLLRFDEANDASWSGEFSHISSFLFASTSFLRRLKAANGSLVLIKNKETSVGRVAKIIATDKTPPHLDSITLPCRRVMGVFPSQIYPIKPNCASSNAEEIVFVSPLLAFNLGLHTSCLRFLLCNEGNIFKYFGRDEDQIVGQNTSEENLSLKVEVTALPTVVPKYASRLRICLVNIPKCCTPASLKGLRNSPFDICDHQKNMIKSSIHEFFKVDRFLMEGDIFCLHKVSNCTSELCFVCSDNSAKKNDLLYFKVASMEPSDELVFRVNCSQTALVLGGAAPSAIPPYNLFYNSSEQVPPQIETIKTLSTSIARMLCPSIHLNYRFGLLLYGPSGCGKRTVVRYLAKHTGYHVVEYSCHDMLASSGKGASDALAAAFKAAQRFAPCIMLLQHLDAFANHPSNEGPRPNIKKMASIIMEYSKPILWDDEAHATECVYYKDLFLVGPELLKRHPIIIVASAVTKEGLQTEFWRCFTYEINMAPLTEEQRRPILIQKLIGLKKMTNYNKDFSLELLRKLFYYQTSGFMPWDIDALFADIAAKLVHNAFISCEESTDNGAIDVEKVILNALERSKKQSATALGSPKVPNAEGEYVSHLEEVKKSIFDMVQASSRNE